MREFLNEINAEVETLIDSGRYDTEDDFTVVFQPGLVNGPVPILRNGNTDFGLFAPDCFHFSQRTHAIGKLNFYTVIAISYRMNG